VKYHDTIYLVGLDSFHENPIIISSATITNGVPGSTSLQIILTAFNPSSAAAYMGPITLDIYINGTWVANGTSVLDLNRGYNHYIVDGNFYLTKDNAKVAREFFSNYSTGIATHMVAIAKSSSTKINVLKYALEHFNAPLVLPGLNKTLIQYMHLEYSWKILFYFEIPAKLTVFNPWNCTLSLYGGYLKADLKGKYIGYWKDSFPNNPIVVPPGQPIITRSVLIHAEHLTEAEWKAILGDITLHVYGTLTLAIGNKCPCFVQTVDYEQMVEASFKQQ